MKKIIALSVLISALVGVNQAVADVLTLKDGQTLTGSLVSRDAKGVVFKIAGQSLTFTNDNVASISFDDSNVSAPKESIKAAAVTELQKSNTEKTAPAGTRVVARTNTAINSKQHNEGYKFNARLEADMVANGVVIAPRGTTLYGVIGSSKKSGRLVGKSELVLTFTDIMINNQMLPISTSVVKAVTDGTGKRTVGTTARTAAIGGLMNGSKGAKDGAKVGLGLSLLSSGNAINIPPGTMLEFQLATPLTVK